MLGTKQLFVIAGCSIVALSVISRADSGDRGAWHAPKLDRTELADYLAKRGDEDLRSQRDEYELDDSRRQLARVERSILKKVAFSSKTQSSANALPAGEAREEKRELENQIDGLEDALSESERLIVALQQTPKTSASKLTASQAELEKQRHETARMQNRIEYLEHLLELSQKQTHELEDNKLNEISTLRETQRKLSSEIEEYQAQLRNLLSERNQQAPKSKEFRDPKHYEDTIAALEKKISRYRGDIETLRADFSVEVERSEELASKLFETTSELENTRAVSAKLVGELEKLEALRSENEELTSKLSSTEKQLSEQVALHQKQLAALPDMEKELIQTKNELLLKDAEIETLAVSTTKPRAKPKAISTTTPVITVKGEGAASQVKALQTQDVLIAEVTAKKANLRSGPGSEHSPVMQLQQGSRLTVEARHGDWFRVLSPTGSRAYIRSDIVKLHGKSVPRQAPRMVGRTVKPTRRAKTSTAKSSAAVTPNQDEVTKAFEELRSGLGLTK